jgi:hypothetical protein
MRAAPDEAATGRAGTGARRLRAKPKIVNVGMLITWM